MNLQSLASHTIDIDLLPDEPTVLDVGCRWFDFTRGILAYRPKARIIALDPSSDVTWPPDLPLGQVSFAHVALIGGDDFSTNFAEGIAGDGGGNFALQADSHGDYRIRRVLCMNLAKLMHSHQVKHFDAIKLDAEGSEFGILENLPGPVATQISVEWHDWTGPWKQHGCGAAMAHMERLGYRTIQHELSKQGTGIGHWDSLFVLKATV
jgi:FkbM family methyltransferase